MIKESVLRQYNSGIWYLDNKYWIKYISRYVHLNYDVDPESKTIFLFYDNYVSIDSLIKKQPMYFPFVIGDAFVRLIKE